MEYLTIGQLAKRVEMRTSALRYYESQGLVLPTRRSVSGYRLYAPETEQEVRFVQRARHLGFALADIRALLDGWRDGLPDEEAVIRIAEDRYLELEQQVTQALVLRRELGLFLQDLYQGLDNRSNEDGQSLNILFERLLERVCNSAVDRSPEYMFDWLMERTGCVLSTDEGQRVIKRLSGQHFHIWREEEGYSVLVVSKDKAIREAMESLAELESRCQVHSHAHKIQELVSAEEGFVFTVYGDNAFIFARLFLSLSA